MTMTSNEKRMLEREALRSVIQQWNANRLDLFELSEPDENLQFHGVMRFYFQDSGQKVATKCIRVASDATVSDVIETLIEKFRPDMRMLTQPNYALYELHSNGEERKLNADEKPLLVQLNWHIDDREGRFLLRNTDQKPTQVDNVDTNFKRKLSKREKKEQKKKEKLAKLNSNPIGNSENDHVAEKLYTALPETSFTRSISNPEAVMRRRRQQILEKKLQQFRSKDGGPDTGGTLKIYGESLCRDVPYKTLLLSIRDCAQAVVREMLAKYGLDKTDPLHYCLVQVNSDGTEYILDDDECPLSILMNHPTSRGSIMFHVRRRPADSQPRRRKKKPLGVSNGGNNMSVEREGPTLVEITHSGEGGRRVKLGSEPIEVGSANTNPLQLFGPSIQPRHCLISYLEGVCTVTPLHADALTFVNGHHIQQPTVVHNGSVVMFGRVASYRFVDSPSDGRYNLALSQSQLDSACLYESRSPASPTWQEEEHVNGPGHSGLTNNHTKPNSYLDGIDTRSLSIDPMDNIKPNTNQQQQQQQYMYSEHSGSLDDNNKTLIADDMHKQQLQLQHQDNGKEHSVADFDPDGNTETETKSVSSIKSNGSNSQDMRPKLQAANAEMSSAGQEPILPAVLEFPETHQESFLRLVIADLDVNVPNFKLAPVYTLYLCARYRASTHYRPDLQPTERATKLTVFLHHVASMIYEVIQEQQQDPKVLAFWMANSSEFLHFLKSDRHISAFSVQAQEVLDECVQVAFNHLVNCVRIELSQTLSQFLSENIDHEPAAGLVLTVLGSAMALLRRCRVNAALTIQLFSQLFHYINVISFNTIVTNPLMCTEAWGKVMSDRLNILESWAHRQGLELAAECHLAKINQCAGFLQAKKTNVTELQNLACSCFRLNSLQTAALLSQENIPKNLVDAAVRMAESVADELSRADGREILLEESPDLLLTLLIPDDGFSSDVVRGIPAGLVDFLSHPQAAGMCRLAAQPTSVGLWTVYMHQYNARSSSVMSTKLPQPEVQVIKLHKNSNGMGLSIVAAKGAGQERLGIYIKSVVQGGAADADGRLQAGDQLLKVDGQSLIGITQERAADYLVRTGPVVELEVAKQGAIFHGLATLLQQPSPVIQRGNRRMSERDLNRIGADGKPPLAAHTQQLPNSKSVPALHHVGNMSMGNNKSRSIHNLTGNSDQSFYQNLSVYRAQNQSQPNLGERSQLNPTITSPANSIAPTNQQVLARPASAYFNTNNSSANNTNTMPPQVAMPYMMQPNNNIGVSNTNTMSHQSLTMNNRQKNAFIREGQNQQSLRMNQMMAPSMPNIAHSSGYASNISASQSMQNVNMIHANNGMNYHNYMPSQAGGNPQAQAQYMYQQDLQQQQLQQNSLARGQSKLLEMGEMLKRRQQRQQDMMPMHSLDVTGQPAGPPIMLSPTGSQSDHHHSQQHLNHGLVNKSQPGMGGYMQNMPMSPVKQLPPTAPKPQINRQPQFNKEEISPPLPPSATHPLFKTTSTGNNGLNQNYNSNASIPPPKNFAGPSPWEREEREKDMEIRREQSRQWREYQISDLSSQQHRSPQQEEQLKTLILERDFQRLAQEQNELEDEIEGPYAKENQYKEVVRLAQNTSISQMAAPVTNMKQVDVKMSVVSQTSPSAGTNSLHDSPTSSLSETLATANFVSAQPAQITSLPTGQPKSILKHNNARADGPSNNSNPSSPSKQAKSTSFAVDRESSSGNAVSQVARDLNSLSFNDYESNSSINSANYTTHDIRKDDNSYDSSMAAPPPPPERNSSYVIMSQKQQNIRNSVGGTTVSSQHTSVSKSTTASNPTAIPTITEDHQQHANFTAASANKKPLPNNNNNNAISSSTANGNGNSNGNNGTAINCNANTSNNNGQATNMQSVSQMSIAAVMASRDNKRVSFHDEENNYMGTIATNDTNDLEAIREDPNRFIQETTAILQTPTTPEGESWNTSTQATPGVIGAQEVYRDPRTRRLAEKQQLQQQQKSGEAVPEKMTFKEKMKLFALESGENQTPKDKLKISRAQRDIDAVH